MTLYRKKPIMVDLEVFDGTPESLERLARFVGDDKPSDGPGTLDEVEQSEDGPRLAFYCLKARAITSIGVGGAIAREADGEGYYPISKAVLATMFEFVGDPPDDAPMGPDLEAALERIAGELE